MSAVLWVRRLVPGDVRDAEPALGVLPTVAMRYDGEDALNVIAVALAENFLGWAQDSGTDAGEQEAPWVLGADGPVALKLGHYVTMVGPWWQVVDPVTFGREFRVLEDLTQVLGRLTHRPEHGRGPRPAVGE